MKIKPVNYYPKDVVDGKEEYKQPKESKIHESYCCKCLLWKETDREGYCEECGGDGLDHKKSTLYACPKCLGKKTYPQPKIEPISCYMPLEPSGIADVVDKINEIITLLNKQ